MTILDALSLVIVDEPGRARNALRTMLVSTQNVRIVDLFDTCSDLNLWMSYCFPDVVVISERSMRGECRPLLKSIKAAYPRSRFLVILEKSDQAQAWLAQGADQVFLKGFSSSELFALMDQWSMDKMMHNFSDGQMQPPPFERSSYMEITT